MPSRPIKLNATQATGLLISIITGLHLIAGMRVGLTGDAAHYALYGAHLAWSYFDHPPMIGWLQASAETLAKSNIALRAWPIALGTASAVVLYRLARQIYPESSPWLGFLAVAVMQSAIIISLMGMSMLPDDPLLFFFLLAAGALYRVLVENQAKAWLWVGLWFGLAGLSKYTAVALVVSAVWLMVSERRWSQLRTPWPWLGVLIAFLAISPVLAWNAAHQWVSFRYQILHVSDPGRHWQLAKFIRSQLIQFFSYSPGIYILGWLTLAQAAWRRHEPRNRFLLAMVIPVFVIIDSASGTNVSLPHWPAIGWAILSIGIANWLMTHWSSRWVKLGTTLSATYSVLLIGIIFSELIHPWVPFKNNAYPLADLYGWQRATDQAEDLRTNMANTPGPIPVLYAGNWSYASHIAWYAYPQPVQIIDNKMHQMTLWYGNASAGSRGILLVPRQFHSQIPLWLAKFDYCTATGQMIVPLEGKIATTYYFYRCKGYHG